jgi:hypothetical protein
LNVVVARSLAVSKVEREKKLFARVLCWLLRTEANFWKSFTNMLSLMYRVGVFPFFVQTLLQVLPFGGLFWLSPLVLVVIRRWLVVACALEEAHLR